MSQPLLPPLEWHNETRLVKDLVPYEFNPRILTENRKEKLRRSREKFNLAEIPAINTDNVIIAGHQRVKLLMELGRGDELIDVRVPNRALTDKEFKEYNISSNVQIGYWDVDILEEIFSDIDLEALGLNVNDIVVPEAIIPEELRQEEADPDFEPELPADPITRKGDVYELVSLQKNLRHRLICGDSRDPQTYHELLGSERVNLAATDPPYNVNYHGAEGTRQAIQNDNLDQDSFYGLLSAFYKNTFEYLHPGAPIYVFHADTEGVNFRQAFVGAGFKLSQCLIWKKNSIVLSRQDYHWIHEPCLYGWKEGAAHPWYSDRKQSTILEFDRPSRSDEHPTMKPVPLMSYLICNSSQQKDIVLDPFLGSGPTLISCEMHWRNGRGIELEERYVDVSIRRWVQHMQKHNRKFEVYRNGVRLVPEQIQDFL